MAPDTIFGRAPMFYILLVGCMMWVSCSEEKCEPIPGVDSLIQSGKVVLLGELHGTQEGPEAIEQLACLALQNNLSVTIGLELPQADQEVITTFLESNGSETERNKIIALNFWGRDYQDGRASQAMLALLDWARTQKKVDIILIDKPSSGDRDFEMAQRILSEYEKKPSNFYAVLTGNIHNMVNRGSGRMGTYVQEKLGKSIVTSLKQVSLGGTAWVCLAGEGCGAFRLGGTGSGQEGVQLDETLNDYDGILEVDSIHASLPARELLNN